MTYTSHSRWYKEKNYELRLKRTLRKDLRNKIIGWAVVFILIVAIEILFISAIK